MELSQRNIIIGLCVLGVIGIGVYVYLGRVGANIPAAPVDEALTVATSSASVTTGSTVSDSAPVTLHLDGGVSMPLYTTPLSFSSTVSQEVRQALQVQYDALVAQLAKNTNQMDLWLSLGALRKIAGDYAGAIEDWNFVAADGSSVSYIAYGNLADLYSNFVKDYPKAEASYLAAIKLEPTYVDFYRGLYQLYAGVYKKGTAAAEDILKKGIATNPKSVDLQVMLAQYYLSVGRTADAKAEYDAAIANAKAQGLTSLAAQIQAEKDSI